MVTRTQENIQTIGYYFMSKLILIRRDHPFLHFHLTSAKFSLADNAKTLVIDRSPVSKSIFSAQHREPIVEFEMGDHNAKGSLLFASTSTIGLLDDCVIG